MKLNEYIEELKDMEKQFGDLPLIYAIDDEGNGYRRVSYCASPMTEDDGEFENTLAVEEPTHICIN